MVRPTSGSHLVSLQTPPFQVSHKPAVPTVKVAFYAIQIKPPGIPENGMENEEWRMKDEEVM